MRSSDPNPIYSIQCNTSRTIDQRGRAGAASCPRIQCLKSASSVPSLRFRSIHVLMKRQGPVAPADRIRQWNLHERALGHDDRRRG